MHNNNNIDIERLKQSIPIVEIARLYENDLIEKGGQLVGAHSSKHSSVHGTCFSVSPAKQVYNCFHCGDAGSVVDLVMNQEGITITEAIQKLTKYAGLDNSNNSNGKRNGKTMSASVSTKNIRKMHADTKKVREIIKTAFEFYHSQLQTEHRNYLNSRGFTNETIDNLLIGYAPGGGGALRDHLKSQKVKPADALATGLFNRSSQRAYDHYQDRIVFPYWQSGEILYSIARLRPHVDTEKRHEADRSKYKKHLLHSEKYDYVSSEAVKHILYGIDSIRDAKDIVITEGMPDVILAHQAGFPAISPITTNVNDRDIDRLLERSARVKSVAIINDNETSQSGLNGAIRTAKAYFRSDIAVKIVQLPKPSEIDKVDLADFLNVAESDKEKRIKELRDLIENAPTFLEQQLDQIEKQQQADVRRKELTSLIQSIYDFESLRQEEIINAIAKRKLASKKSIKDTIKDFARKQKLLGDDPLKFNTMVTEHRYQGVYEGLDNYKVAVVKEQGEQMIVVSSFKLSPTARIVQENGMIDELCDIISDSGMESKNVLFRREDFADAKTFRTVLPSTEYAYWGNTEVLQKIGKLLGTHEVPVKKGTDKIGKHESGVWICPNSQIITAEKGLIPNDVNSDAEVVYLPRAGQSEMNSQINYCTSSNIAPRVRSLVADLFQLNDENVMTLIVSWLFATPFTVEIKKLLSGFPTLTITGTRGTGKSTLFELLSGLVGYNGQLFGCGQSKFVLTKLISSSTSVPVIFDEYKNDLQEDVKRLFGRYVRRSYKSEKDYRGNANQTLTEYSLTAPLAILGEIDFTGESALLDRSIRINFSPNDLDEFAHAAYKKIRRINLNEIGTEYIRFCLSQDRKAIEKAISELPEMPEDLSFRMADNFKAVAFGWTMFNRFIAQYTTVNRERQEKQLNNAIQHLYNETCEVTGGTKLAVDRYIEQLATMAETGRIHRGIHFDFIDNEERNEIYLRNDACFAEYVKFAREIDENTLTLTSYRRQLKENSERGGYITDHRKIIRLAGVLPTMKHKRVVVIDKEKAIDYGLEDLDGFKREAPKWLDE